MSNRQAQDNTKAGRISSDKYNYGKLWKNLKIIINDGSHANFLAKLRFDHLTQKRLMKEFIKGYLEDNEHIRGFIDQIQSNLPNRKKVTIKKEIKLRKKNVRDFGLDDSDIEGIFHDLEKESYEDESV